MTDLDPTLLDAMLAGTVATTPAEDILVAALREARAKIAAMQSSLIVQSEAQARTSDERDDWRRRYEALRDGVTGLCDELTSLGDDTYPTAFRAVVARAEGDES